MNRWVVPADGEQEPLLVAESVDGAISLHMPSPEPVVVTVEMAEHVRQIIGAAIACAQGST
jgi:hypothetical protein